MKSHFWMLAPDVEIDDGKGTILISSEEGETEGEGSNSAHIVINHHPRTSLFIQIRNFLHIIVLICFLFLIS